MSFLTVLLGLWIGWLISWLLAAGWTSKTETLQSHGSRLRQSVPIWIGAILMFRPLGEALATPLFPFSPWIGWLAVALASLGFALTWWARVHLGKNWSAAVTLKADHSLIRSGPYCITRHPIYTGLILALLATVIAKDSVAALLGVAFVTVGLVMKSRQEEQFLTRQFGAAYDVYKREVPALVPRAW